MNTQSVIQVLQDNIACITAHGDYIQDIVNAFRIDLEDITPAQLHAVFTHRIYFQQIIAATKIYSEYGSIPRSSKNVTYIHPLKIWAAPKNPKVLDYPGYATRTIIEHNSRKITVISNQANWDASLQLKSRLAGGYENVTHLEIIGPVTIIIQKESKPGLARSDDEQTESDYDDYYPESEEEPNPEAEEHVEAW